MELTHTQQFYSVILLPEKYDLMHYNDNSTNLNFNITFTNGAVAFVPIYEGELLRGVKMPELHVQGMTHGFQSSWTSRETETIYKLNLPLTGVVVINNNTSNECLIEENHTSSTTSFN